MRYLSSKMTEKKYKPGPQIFMTGIISFSGILIGGNFSIPAVLIPALQAEENPDLRVDLKMGSHFVTMWLATSMFSGMLGGWLADHIGRKKVLLMAQVPFILGWAIKALAASVTQILIGRAVAGFAHGIIYALLPVYISEIATPDLRASLCSWITVMNNMGCLAVYILGATVHWRVLMWSMCGINLIALLSVALFLHETPYFLVSKRNDEQAKATLQKLRGDKYDITKELGEICARKKYKENQHAVGQYSKLSVLCSPAFMMPFLGVGVTFAISMCSGSGILAMFMINIFQESGTNINPFLASILVILLRFATSLISSFAMRVVGKKILFLVTGLIMTAGFFCLAGVSYMRIIYHQDLQQTFTVNSNSSNYTEDSVYNVLPNTNITELENQYSQILFNETKHSTTIATGNIRFDNNNSIPNSNQTNDTILEAIFNWTPIVSIIVILANQTFGFSNVLRVSIGEVFPTEVRSMGSAICLFFASVALGLNGVIFPYFLDWFQFHGTFGIFGLLTLAVTFYGFLMLPESKGKTLVNLEEHFEEQYSKRRSVKQKKVEEAVEEEEEKGGGGE